tara:strand:- start:260 stop:541 length:282 start_codon:yes stop_codon:yes gene_type:complete
MSELTIEDRVDLLEDAVEQMQLDIQDAAGDCDITSVDLQQNEAFRAVGRHLYQHIEERYEPAMDKLNRRLQSIENAIAEIRDVEYNPTDFESD